MTDFVAVKAKVQTPALRRQEPFTEAHHMNPLRQDDPRYRMAVKEVAHAGYSSGSSVIDIYFDSLRRQGVVLVDQPLCEACEGTGELRKLDPKIDEEDAWYSCPRCSGSGRARMVTLDDVVEAIRKVKAATENEPKIHPSAEYFATIIELKFLAP